MIRPGGRGVVHCNKKAQVRNRNSVILVKVCSDMDYLMSEYERKAKCWSRGIEENGVLCVYTFKARLLCLDSPEPNTSLM